MLLMSDDLAGRLDEKIINEVIDEDLTLQIVLGDESLKFGVLSVTLNDRQASLTFKTQGSLAFELMTRPQHVTCHLLCNGRARSFKLQDHTVTWDNAEGKQLCTIITSLDSARGVTNE